MFILDVPDYSPKYTTSGYLNGKPTIEELCQHVTIDTKWYKFGELLKLDTTDLDNVDQQCKDDHNKVSKMFELWLSTSPNAIRREIIDALLNSAINENVLAKKYMKALMESEYKIANLIGLSFLPFFIKQCKIIHCSPCTISF